MEAAASRILRTIALLCALAMPPAWGIDVMGNVGLDPVPGASLPGDAFFMDSEGGRVRLGDLLGERPAVIVPAYYECPNLCMVMLDGVLESMAAIDLTAGKDFTFIVLGIDPREGPRAAHNKRKEYLKRYGRAGADRGWHFLTGEQKAIRQVTDALGIRYIYDPDLDQYAHPAVLVTVTPDSRASTWFQDVRVPAPDLRLALVEASAGELGTLADRALLLCYRYDPESGRYTLAIMNVLRLGGLLTVAGLGVMVWRLHRRGGGG